MSIFSSDLDGDGDNDLAVSNLYHSPTPGNISILKNNGSGAFQAAINYGVMSRPLSVFACDFDGDRANDLAVTNFISNNVSILKNNGNGTFQSAVNYAVEYTPRSVFACDLDGDGDEDNDIAIANSAGDNISILFNQGGLCNYLPGDINGDGLIRGSDVTYGVRYFKGIGAPPPDSCYNDSVGTSTHWLYVAGDVNGDCKFTGSDITRMVTYFKGLMPLVNCRFFPLPAKRLNTPTVKPTMIQQQNIR